MAQGARTLFAPIAGWLRYLLERVVVLPAADLLPRRWALRVADVVGFVDLLVPSTTAIIALGEARASTGLRGWRRVGAAGRRLGGSRRDLVMMRRLRRGVEHPREWNIIEVNGDQVHELIAERRSFVVATGHFHHAAELAVGNGLYPWIANREVTSAMPPWRFSPRIMRERLQNHLFFGIAGAIEGGEDRQFFPPAGDPALVPAILEALALPDGCVRIFIDAIWTKAHAHRRPFAGMRERAFAFGAARIARLAQCPVILEVCIYQPDGSVRIEWGPCIEPPSIDDVAADVRVIDQLVDALEIAVGHYPEQYLHPIGRERRWNAAMNRWEPGALAESALADESLIAHRA